MGEDSQPGDPVGAPVQLGEADRAPGEFTRHLVLPGSAEVPRRGVEGVHNIGRVNVPGLTLAEIAGDSGRGGVGGQPLGRVRGGQQVRQQVVPLGISRRVVP